MRSPYDDGSCPDVVIIGSSSLLKNVVSIADAVSTNDCVVLIEGESGTGKELLTRHIHARSRRRAGPFIPVNCAGISESLFESQFFGHVRGAFTGAVSETLGVVRAAEGGTLLLDEVSEIPLRLQAKLLRLLQEKEVIPVGGTRPVQADVRFITTTNVSLQKAVESGRFRPDLYHRLNIVRIEVPPLRCRTEDIDSILDYYLEFYAQEYSMPIRVLGKGIRQQIQDYCWPGNVRELCNYVERLYAADIPPLPPTLVTTWLEDARHVQDNPPLEPKPGRITEINDKPLTYTLAEAERSAILIALKRTGWNRSAAAKLLKVHRSTLMRKMRNHKLNGLT
ncbi:MAG: sigma 54-interacting transcriptional regulator [Planctomycetota bacterium]|nr:sigma 54-interacting transcriptional regulator [Planctomycetota bacterium]